MGKVLLHFHSIYLLYVVEMKMRTKSKAFAHDDGRKGIDII